MLHTKIRFGLLASLALASTSCTVPTEQGDAPPLETSEQPLVQYYHWRYGQPFKPLMQLSEGFCYLTRIAGEFAGGGEWVEVWGNVSNGRWWLGGGSLTSSHEIEAEAHCVSYDSFSGATWGFTPASVPVSSNNTSIVGPLTDVTFLSRMQGDFNGGGEWLNVFPTSTDWRVNANAASGTGTSGRAVSARLMTPANATRPVTYAMSASQMAPWDGLTYDNVPVRLIPTSSGVCYLTAVGGAFKGYGEYVWIYAAHGYWWLRAEANSTNTQVNAVAQCISF